MSIKPLPTWPLFVIGMFIIWFASHSFVALLSGALASITEVKVKA